MKILIVDDDKDIVELLSIYVKNEGYEVERAYNGKEAITKLNTNPDIGLMILDIMMPQMDGLAVVREVRKDSQIPVLMLSAKTDDLDKIQGLIQGADDYVTKPFNPLEIVARVKAAFRRFYDLNTGTGEVSGQKMIRYRELAIDMETLQLFKNGEEIRVTPTEIKILMLLMKNPGRVYTKVQIYEYLRGEYFENDENTIMVHISNLREKIEDDPKQPEYLLTVRGLGYKIGAARP